MGLSHRNNSRGGEVLIVQVIKAGADRSKIGNDSLSISSNVSPSATVNFYCTINVGDNYIRSTLILRSNDFKQLNF